MIIRENVKDIWDDNKVVKDDWNHLLYSFNSWAVGGQRDRILWKNQSRDQLHRHPQDVK